MFRKISSAILTSLVFYFLVSCSSAPKVEKVLSVIADGKYDTEFPSINSSQQLEEISRTIRMINSIAFYDSYVFNKDSLITKDQINRIDLGKTAIKKNYFNKTASGTATVVLESQGIVALLTVAHIVSFPDTMISYFMNPDGTFSQFVQSISIKNKQSNYVPDLPSDGKLDLIAIDKERDLALLGRRFTQVQSMFLPVFKYPWGSSSELDWGSFVYIFAYPMNYKVVSKAIVSKPTNDKSYFIIDASFLRGCSGGIVLALRDGVPNFELVGLIRAVPADFEYYIRPLIRDSNTEFNTMLPYNGEVYVDKQQIPQPGITKVIKIEEVRQFLLDNKALLVSQGYGFKELFK